MMNHLPWSQVREFFSADDSEHLVIYQFSVKLRQLKVAWYRATQQADDETVDEDVLAAKEHIALMPLGQIKQETIVVQNVSKYYGSHMAVKDVSFMVKR